MEGGARRKEGEVEERRSGQYTRNLQRIFHQEFRTVTSCDEDQVLLISTSTPTTSTSSTTTTTTTTTSITTTPTTTTTRSC